MKIDHSIAIPSIEQHIFIIRGCKVMIDRDLAGLYGVETKYLNRQVKRNHERFPPEFMFQLTREEKEELVTNWHRFSILKHSTVLPYVFTEHGVAMLATVLNSEQAIRMSILVIKAFVKLRELLSNQHEVGEKLKVLESKIEQHDQEIQAIMDAIRKLLQPQEKPRRPIGFQIKEPKTQYLARRKKK